MLHSLVNLHKFNLDKVQTEQCINKSAVTFSLTNELKYIKFFNNFVKLRAAYKVLFR